MLRSLDSLVKDGSIKRSSIEEVRKLLVDAQRKVDQLQALSVAH
ncbi:hypothetical protein [Ramlibacter sp. Leaf400]|nr:hypothetical protein [Ramlibacter sp. Leaf400]